MFSNWWLLDSEWFYKQISREIYSWSSPCDHSRKRPATVRTTLVKARLNCYFKTLKWKALVSDCSRKRPPPRPLLGLPNWTFLSFLHSRKRPLRVLFIQKYVSRNNPRETRFSNGTQVKPCRSGLRTGWVINREYLHKGPYVVLSFLLLLLPFCVLCSVQARKERGYDWCVRTPPPPPTPQASEVHVFIDQRLKTKWSRNIVLHRILIYWLCSKIL